VDLIEWTHAQSIQVATAYLRHQQGRLPVLAQKSGQPTLMSTRATTTSSLRGRTDLCALVSSYGQRVGLDRQLTRLGEWAAQARLPWR
jgi:putative resolvase